MRVWWRGAQEVGTAAQGACRATASHKFRLPPDCTEPHSLGMSFCRLPHLRAATHATCAAFLTALATPAAAA